MLRVPGEQSWSKSSQGSSEVTEAQVARRQLPKEVYSKFPLPGNEGKYLGALIKVGHTLYNAIMRPPLTSRYTMETSHSSPQASTPLSESCRRPHYLPPSKQVRTTQSLFPPFTSSRSSINRPPPFKVTRPISTKMSFPTYQTPSSHRTA